MKKVAIIASLAAGLALQQVANAGVVFQDPVFIVHDPGSATFATYASGSFHQALLSSDSVEYVGCAVHSSYSLTEVVCAARDARNNFAGCYTASPSQAMLQVAAAINEYSLIYFAANSYGQCTLVEVDNSTYNK